MGFWRFGWLFFPIVLVGCGSSKPSTTLTVTCRGGVAASGLTKLDVLGAPVNGRAVISFPDPVNPGKTGGLSIPTDDRCTVTPTVATTS